MKRILLIVLLFFGFTAFGQFTEDFESDTFPPIGWTVINTGAGGGQIWQRTTSATMPPSTIGNGSAFIQRENIGTNNTEEDWLITPQILISDNSVLSFTSRTGTTGDQGTFYQIRVSTQSDPSTYVTVATWSENEMTASFNMFEDQTVSLGQFAGQSIFIAFVRMHFQWSAGVSGDRWLVDNVALSGTSTGITQAYNTINGEIYYNANGDCSGQNPIQYVPVQLNITGNGPGAITSYHSYQFNNFLLNSDITVNASVNHPFFTVSPAQYVYNFSTLGNTETATFCMSTNGFHPDLKIYIIPVTVAQPGMNVRYRVVCRNEGNQTHNATITFQFDDTVLDYLSSFPIGSQSGNTISWSLPDADPFTVRTFDVLMNLNTMSETPAVNIGDTLEFAAAVTSDLTDESPSDNLTDYTATVIGPYDPNDKIVLEGPTISLVQANDYLHYIIRFQNIGSAPAQTVVVRDFIEQDLDINTLEFIDGSHPFTATRNNANMLEMRFDNIDLPDSTTDEPNSHGFIAFKIKPVSTASIGTVFSNNANIYFDYNLPIATNTVTTTVTQLANAEFHQEAFVVYPNPATEMINIQQVSSDDITSITIYNILGQTVHTPTYSASETPIDISNLTSGTYFVEVRTQNSKETKKLIKM